MSKHATAMQSAPRVAALKSARQIAVDQAEDLLESGQIQDGFAQLAEAEEKWPDDVNIPFLIGKYKLKEHAAKEGLEKLQAVLATHPNHIPSLLEIGNYYIRQGHMIQANPYVQRALEAAPKDPGPRCTMGSLQQRLGNLPAAVEQYRTALGLQLQMKNALPREDSGKKREDFRIQDAEGMLWDTLALMSKNGIHMFAAFGTLLGLVRTGGLFKHDKDVDTGIPHSEMSRAVAILRRHGWVEVAHSFGYINPRAMYNRKTGLSMDISGFVIDAENGKALTAGAWMPGVPKDWNMIFEFDAIQLEKRPTPDGKGQMWCMVNPEHWLETIYGDWRTPDKNFDTMVAAKNIRAFSLLTRCFAYSRVSACWSEGRLIRARMLARHTLERDPGDHLMQKVVARLSR